MFQFPLRAINNLALDEFGGGAGGPFQSCFLPEFSQGLKNGAVGKKN